jgi:hypothetical protein
MSSLSVENLLPDDSRIQVESKKLPVAVVLQLLIGGVFGAGAMLGAIYILEEMSGWQALMVFAALMISLWLQLLIHETGHTIGGLSMGMQLLAVGVGRLRVERSQHGWRAHWGAKIAGIGGFASLVPRAGAAFSRKTQAVYLFGGPFANLLCAALVFICLTLFDLAPMTKTLLGIFAGCGLAIGVTNLIPFYTSGFRSDGGGLIDLWRRPQLVTGYFQLQQLVALSMAGERPRDWPQNLLPDLSSAVDELRMPIASLRMSWAIDKQLYDEADKTAQELWDCYHDKKTAALQRNYLALGLAGYAAIRCDDLQLTQAWRERSVAGMLDISAHLAHLDAEIARLRGDKDQLQSLLEQARAKLPRVQDGGSRKALSDRLDWLQQYATN